MEERILTKFLTKPYILWGGMLESPHNDIANCQTPLQLANPTQLQLGWVGVDFVFQRKKEERRKEEGRKKKKE